MSPEPVTFGPAGDPRPWVGCANTIAARLASGEFPDGKWLPLQKDLATGIGVNPGVIGRAITELREKGLITLVRGLGCYAGNGPQPAEPPPVPARRLSVSREPRRVRPLSDPGDSLLGEQYIPVKELAAALHVSVMTVHRIIQNGDIEGVIIVGDKNIRIPMSGVRAYLESRRIDGLQIDLSELGE